MIQSNHNTVQHIIDRSKKKKISRKPGCFMIFKKTIMSSFYKPQFFTDFGSCNVSVVRCVLSTTIHSKYSGL